MPTTETGTRIDEVADGIHRISTFVPDAGLCFNQYLLVAEQPLLFHTGPRAMFGSVREAVAKVIDPTSLRWIAFGHVESDECGAMNEWLAAAPEATVVGNTVAVLVSLNDLADRPPLAIAEGEVLELGGKRVRSIPTPHVPHGWDAHVLYEEATGTLLCGDLFTSAGPMPATSTDDIVGPAIAAEDMFGYTSVTAATAPTIRRLADLAPATLALMHGPAFAGDTVAALRDLADDYDGRLRRALEDQAAVA